MREPGHRKPDIDIQLTLDEGKAAASKNAHILRMWASRPSDGNQ
jgi:hypothetical protein